MSPFKHRFYIFFFFLMPLSVFAQKTDKLHLDNDDWITGELIKMTNGLVTFKTDAAQTIQVKWDRIYQIRSDKYFEVFLASGNIYYGMLDVTEDDAKYKILVKMLDTDIVLNMNDITQITQIKNRFWGKMHGYVDIGFSYNKGSEVMMLNSNFKVEYRPRKSVTTIQATSNFTSQPDKETTKKQDLSIAYDYIFKHMWAYSAFTSFQQNTELGIQLRSSLGSGISKGLVNTSIMRFIPTIGIIVNREKALTTEDKTTNLEGVVRLDYKIFKFRKPEVHLDSYFNFYPSFTVKDRYRTDFNLQVQFKFVKNFYLKLSFYHTLDTKPPNEDKPTADWGFTTSVGVKFN